MNFRISLSISENKTWNFESVDKYGAYHYFNNIISFHLWTWISLHLCRSLTPYIDILSFSVHKSWTSFVMLWRSFNGKKKTPVFSTKTAETTVSIWESMKLDLFLMYIKINSRWTKNLNVRAIINFLEIMSISIHSFVMFILKTFILFGVIINGIVIIWITYITTYIIIWIIYMHIL